MNLILVTVDKTVLCLSFLFRKSGSSLKKQNEMLKYKCTPVTKNISP